MAKSKDSVHFPGAVHSKFTTSLRFSSPETKDAMPTYRIMDAEGLIVDSSRTPLDISSEEVLKMYLDMLTVSIMDPIMFQAQRQGRLSFYMVSAGEEGIAVGSASALSKDDTIFAQYRETGIFQYRGFKLEEFMNQLFANRKDHGNGRNMPVHYGSKELNIHTISSPLATQLPQAAGAAYALKLQHLQNPETVPKKVVACYFGEGAASEGDFHAALNIAATRSCPVIFLCRNNGYAISTPTLEQYRGDGIASRGVGYGIDTIRVDGNDIFAVREATLHARQLALEGSMRPVLIEAMSYRVAHHSTSDDSSKYRSTHEIEAWKRRDNPITRLRKWMEREGLWDEAKEKEGQNRIKKEVLKAFNEAEREKRPRLGNLFEDVYEEVTEELREQMASLRKTIETYPDEYDVEQFEGGLNGLDRR
jgi:2-oxoisovalerate dehydrogenase E1 component alpha subunit